MQIDTGSLGQALSTAAGIASAEKLSSARIPTRIAVILGDGECQEGQIYESLMSIVHMKLKNITIIVDLNGYQSDRKCDEIMPIHDLATVFKGFGFRMIFINGH
jgi:transketolase